MKYTVTVDERKFMKAILNEKTYREIKINLMYIFANSVFNDAKNIKELKHCGIYVTRRKCKNEK